MEEMQTSESETQDLTPDNRDQAMEPPREPGPAAGGTEKDVKKDPGGTVKPMNIDFLLEVPLQVSVELGRTRMPISELLMLNKGSVIELTQMVDEPMDVLINGKLVAKGEVVVSNEKFGVRIIDIVSPDERIESLK